MLHVRHPPRFWIAAALVVAVVLLGYAGLLAAAAGGMVGIDLQARPCLPWRVYWVAPLEGSITRGDLVMIRAGRLKPASGSPGVKFVRGMPGDVVRVAQGRLFINDVPAVDLHICRNSYRADYCGDRSYRLGEAQFLLLGTDEYSFDSRYWGPVSLADIQGLARPLI